MGPSAVLAGAKNAREAPNRAATASSSAGLDQPFTVATASVSTLTISPLRQSSSTFLRS